MIRRRPKARHNSSRGFTLAEVTIAILVLSAGAIVMISLQSASVDSSFRDERRQTALLAARSVFSALEIESQPPENVDIELPLIELLQKREPLNKLSWKNIKGLEPFSAHFKIENAPLPYKAIPPDELKRATLRVFWSNSPADSIEIFYFIPKKVPS